MTTRLWEDTIILAMRDMQWIHALTEGRPWPSLSMWKLDGRPEESLADLIVAEDQKFFLIEAKSSPDQFESEWLRTNTSTRKREVRPKRSYANLATLLNGSYPEFPSDAAREWVEVSAACHFFAYCEAGNDSSEVLVRGYAEACASHVRNPSDDSGMHPVARVPRLVVAESKGVVRKSKVSFADVLHQKCFALCEQGINPELLFTGVDLKVFMDYIYLLIQPGGSDAEMNAIVLAPGMRFVRVVRSVRDLAIVLGPYHPSWIPGAVPSGLGRQPRRRLPGQ